MTNKQIKLILEAMMHASGLDPVMEDDYYQNITGESIGRFCEGVSCFFQVDKCSWMFHYNNLEWVDTPSSTIDFFLGNKSNFNRLAKVN